MANILKQIRNITTQLIRKQKKDIANTSQNGSEIPNDQSLTEQTQQLYKYDVPNTPFQMIGNKKQGWAITLGQYMLTEPKPTKTECEIHFRRNRWHIIMNMILVMPEILKTAEHLKNLPKTDNNTQK